MPLFLAADITPFDWQRILLSENAPPLYLLEIAARCVVTYLLILGALRITGRRGVRQLSIFELSIILALGSAAGDAMFYDDVPLLHVTVVFVVVSALYVLFNRLTERFPSFSDWLEGTPILLVEDGQIKHGTPGRRHLNAHMTGKRKRQLRRQGLVPKALVKKFLIAMGAY